MGIRKYRPITPGTRTRVASDFAEVTGRGRERGLVVAKHQRKGRNNRGVITCRHRGGGHKRLYRLVDFRRDKHGVVAKVAAIHYDPHRNARLALLFYADGEKRYILAPAGVAVGSTVVSGPEAPIENGNALPLSAIPLGSSVHNVELYAGRGGRDGAHRWRQCPGCRQGRGLRRPQAALHRGPLWCAASATPPSAKWATPRCATPVSARLDASAGSVADPKCAAR